MRQILKHLLCFPALPYDLQSFGVHRRAAAAEVEHFGGGGCASVQARGGDARCRVVEGGGVKAYHVVPHGEDARYVVHAALGQRSVEVVGDGELRAVGNGEFRVVEKHHVEHDEAVLVGDVNLTINGGTLCNLALDMGVGELTLKSRIEGKSDLNYGIGEANLTLLGGREDYQIELDKGIGEARLEGENMRDDSVYGAGRNLIEIDGGIGEINIRFLGNEIQKAS